MQRLILIITGLVCAVNIAYAQSPPEIRPLHIGDTVPDITLNHIINYKTTSAKLFDFKGKQVILDFWATWCSSCIEGFPKLTALQEKFKDRLQVFLVNSKNSTRDTKKKIINFFSLRKLPDGDKYHLPVIVEDTILDRLFQHYIIPHYVWISPTGVLEATTGSAEVSARNIENLLDMKTADFRMKIDEMGFTRNKPLFINDNLQKEQNIKYYSIISGYITGIPGGVSGNEIQDGRITRLCYRNWSIKQLYQMAFRISWPNNRTVLDVADPSKLQCAGNNCDNWYPDHSYCYELILPPTSEQTAYKKMQHDLIDFFRYKAQVEKRVINCLVLKNNMRIKKPVSRDGIPSDNIGNIGESKYIHHEPISTLVDYLNRNLPIPVLDETDFDKPVDMSLPTDLSNISLLKAALRKYGFNLIKSQKTMEVFVITDKTRVNKSTNISKKF